MDKSKMTTIIFTVILCICLFSVMKNFIKKIKLGKIKYEAKLGSINGNLVIGIVLMGMLLTSLINQSKYDLKGFIGFVFISLLSVLFLWMGLMKVGIRQGGIIDKQSSWSFKDIKSYSWNGDEIVFKCKNRIGNKIFLTETKWTFKQNKKNEIDEFLRKNISNNKRK